MRLKTADPMISPYPLRGHGRLILLLLLFATLFEAATSVHVSYLMNEALFDLLNLAFNISLAVIARKATSKTKFIEFLENSPIFDNFDIM